eukprot:TRINITY_DN59326_c0_g1_i1.p1 TRINITY_DN59326_c0_g1~~TRINITY_DN59326_c0_g1_i1.p1  ORF type:complete len:498 (+),score=109.70 TRINITY_DN59326_c0_g1_i1:443-1936(+)
MAKSSQPASADFWATLVAFRRHMHQNPETGFHEFRTQQNVLNFLTDVAKIPEAKIRKSALTGLVADIVGEGPQREGAQEASRQVNTIALRADLDALPMTEENDALPWHSQNPGVAHMCGHDGHTAALLGVAWLLSTNKHKIPLGKTIRLLFQPAEEGTPAGTGGFEFSRTGGGGAVPLMDEGCLENVDEVYGWHNWPAFPLGDLRVKEGGVMACEQEFTVVVKGKGGHGSQPHCTVDPIVAGSAIVSAVQSIVSRNVPSFQNAVISVCKFNSGEVNNVIPNAATLGGTIRTVDVETQQIVAKRFREVVGGVGQSFGCEVSIDMLGVNPLLSNWEVPTECVRECAARLKSAEGLLKIEKISEEGLPLLAGEDFAYYVQQKPGCYFFLGTSEPYVEKFGSFGFVRANRGKLKAWQEPNSKPSSDKPLRSNCICHGVNYDFNDNVLPRAVIMLVKIAEQRLGLGADFLFASDAELEDFVAPVEKLMGLDGIFMCEPCGEA